MQLGNFYIKSGMGVGLEEVELESSEALAETAGTTRLSGHTHHDRDFCQDIEMESDEIDLEEGEFKPDQGAETSGDVNSGWIYYTYKPNTYPHHHGIHSGPHGGNDDRRFRRPPHPH
jgi:hypothetical protein